MKLGTIKWLQVSSALAIGLLGGAYGAFSFTSYFFLDGHYTSLAAALTVDVATLKKLRVKDTKAAIDLLESRVDTNVLALDVPETELSKATHSSVLKVFKIVDDYKKEFNVKSRRDELGERVSEVLSRKSE